MKWAVLTVAGLFLAAGCSDSTSVSQSQARKAFRWFGGLGFPDVTSAQYVRVATGESIRLGGNPPRNKYIEAFLLSEDDVTFSVLTQDLFTRTFEKTEPNAVEYLKVSYEPLNLKAEAAARLGLVHDPPKDDYSRRFGERLAERTELFVLAWACWCKGIEGLPLELCNQIVAMRSHDETGGLMDLVQRDLGHAMTWRAVEMFAVADTPRSEILAAFEHIARYYGKCEHLERVRDSIKVLREMLEEDEAHAKSIKAYEDMSVDEQVVELIFQLRDQNAHQWSQPGRVNVYDDPRGDASPAHLLVEHGYDAVPRLIEALDDMTFTRSVGYVRNYCFSHHVLRVGDCAREILQSISGRCFCAGSHTDPISQEGKAAAVREEVEAWWAELQAKGEKQLWIEGIQKADRDSPLQARWLLDKYPEAALEPIIQGAEDANEYWVRVGLVTVAGDIEGDGPAAFLKEEMVSGPFIHSRVEAARALSRRGVEEALTQMIRLWLLGPNPGEMELAEYLLECGSIEAIQAVEQGLRRRNVGMRIHVIRAVHAAILQTRQAIEGRDHESPDENLKARMSVLLTAMEQLLVTHLADTEREEGSSGSWYSAYFVDPRVCDMAATVLSWNWKDTYTFDIGGALKQRNFQRIACANTWRSRHGLPLLQLPHQQAVATVPSEKIKPLFDTIRNAKTTAEIDGAVAGVEAMGLSVLGAICELLSDMPEDHWARPPCVALARRLSCNITEVSFDDRSAQPDDALTELLNGLKGKPLTSQQFIAILLHVANHMPTGASGIRLEAVRDDDLTGITLMVELTLRDLPDDGRATSWRFGERVIVGSDCIHSSGGNGSHSFLQKAAAYEDLNIAIEKATSSAPRVQLIIRASLIQEESLIW